MEYLFMYVAEALVFLRDVLAPLTGSDTGITWALAILLLSAIIRLVLLPFNVRQFHAQMKMIKVQPQLNVLNKKFKKAKADMEKSPMRPEERAKRVQELQVQHLKDARAVQAEHGFKISRLLVPILLQTIIGFALFHVITSFQPGAAPQYGMDAATFTSVSDATVLGAPLAARLFSSADSIMALGGDVIAARAGVLILVVLTVAITTISIRQSLRRSPVPDPTTFIQKPKTSEEIMQRQMQDIMYLIRRHGPKFLPIIFFLGYAFLPIGLLLNIVVIAASAALFQQVMYRRHPSMVGEPEPGITDVVVTEQKNDEVTQDGATDTAEDAPKVSITKGSDAPVNRAAKGTQRSQPKRKKRR